MQTCAACVINSHVYVCMEFQIVPLHLSWILKHGDQLIHTKILIFVDKLY